MSPDLEDLGLLRCVVVCLLFLEMSVFGFFFLLSKSVKSSSRQSNAVWDERQSIRPQL